jgi:hypothetical protein
MHVCLCMCVCVCVCVCVYAGGVAGVVAPVILERSRTHRDTMHVWWKEMALKRMRGKVGSLLGLAVSLPLLWLACLWAHPMSGLDRRGRVTSTTSTLALKQR